MIVDDRTPSIERTVAIVQSEGEGEPPEMFLTIENSIEDRVRAYSRMVRMRQVLKKTRSPVERG